MKTCPEREILERFVAGTASGCERRQVVRHLLAGCGPCAAEVRSAFWPAIEAGAYDGGWARITAWARNRVLVDRPKPGGQEERIDVRAW